MALALYEDALADPDPSTVGQARFRLGRIAWRQGRFDDALAEYAQAISIAEDRGMHLLRAHVENGIGAVHYARGAYKQARASYAIAEQLAGADTVLRGRIQLNIGVIANIEGDLSGAREAYLRSRDEFAAAGDESGEALVLHNLGMVYADMERWREADESYTRCLEIAERLGNRQMIANVLLNDSDVRCADGRYDEAVAQCERALAIYTEVGDEPGRGDALRGRAHALRRMGHLDAATLSLDEAMRIATHLQARLLEAEVARERGLVATAGGDDVEAERYLALALDAFTELGAQREVAEVRAELAALSEEG